jgi:hypothetical protein
MAVGRAELTAPPKMWTRQLVARASHGVARARRKSSPERSYESQRSVDARPPWASRGAERCSSEWLAFCRWVAGRRTLGAAPLWVFSLTTSEFVGHHTEAVAACSSRSFSSTVQAKEGALCFLLTYPE